MINWGYVLAGTTTLPFPVTTHAQTGAAVAPSTAFETADFILYKNGSATQRTSQSGWTITSPFDSITGLHMLLIDLTDNTDAGFYSAGAFYTLVLSPDETVDGLAVVRVVGTFIIGPVAANTTQWLGTAPFTPATAGIPEVNVKNINNVSASPVTTVKAVQGIAVDGVITTVTNQLTAAAIATGVWQDTTAGDFTTALSVGKSIMNGVALGTGLTIAAVSGAVGSVTGAVGSVTGAVGSVTGAVGSVTGNVGGNVTGSVGSVVGAVGSVTGNVGGNVTGSVASVVAMVNADVKKVNAVTITGDGSGTPFTV